MAVISLLLIILIAFCAVVFAKSYLQGTQDDAQLYVREEISRMPAEIASGQLLSSEKQMYASMDGSSVPVRPDQVYLTSEGLIVPVDTKTRSTGKVYDYDVIELSLQRLALSESHEFAGQGRVATHGYIRIRRKNNGQAISYHRVNLLTREKVLALFHRYHDIILGRTAPTSQTNPRACSGCAYRLKCPKAL